MTAIADFKQRWRQRGKTPEGSFKQFFFLSGFGIYPVFSHLCGSPWWMGCMSPLFCLFVFSEDVVSQSENGNQLEMHGRRTAKLMPKD